MNTDSLSVVQTIVDGLQEEIVTGRLRPGTPLSRRQVASQYNASYSPVIEALVRLEHMGLVEAEPSQTARVRRLTLESIYEDNTLREAIETQAIRRACEFATDAELDELETLAGEVEERLKEWDAEAGSAADWKFHERIAALSRARVLVREMKRLGLLNMLRQAWLAGGPVPEGPNHFMLVEAIRNRDPVQADALMRTHVQGGLEQELKCFRAGSGEA